MMQVQEKKVVSQETPEITAAQGRPWVIRSMFAVALAVFLLLNAALSFSSAIEWDVHKFPYKGWSWWVITDLRAGNRVHNIALLGSSLMCSAVGGADANFLDSNIDMAIHHQASYL